MDDAIKIEKINISELARRWGCSRQYTFKCVKNGCPTHSFEAADEWRTANAIYGAGYRSKGNQVRKKWSTSSSIPPPSTEGIPTPIREPASHPDASRNGNSRNGKDDDEIASIEKSLASAIEVEEEAFRLVRDAQNEQNDVMLAVRTAAFTKAQEGRLKAQEMVLKIKERKKALVPMETAKGVMWMMFVPLVEMLDGFGRDNSGRIRGAESDADAVEECDRAMLRVKENLMKLYERATG